MITRKIEGLTLQDTKFIHPRVSQVIMGFVLVGGIGVHVVYLYLIMICICWVGVVSKGEGDFLTSSRRNQTCPSLLAKAITGK